MSTLAMEVDAALGKLDPLTAAKFTRLVRDAVALVQPDGGAPDELNADYFDAVVGAFADIEFQRPDQGELPPAKVW